MSILGGVGAGGGGHPWGAAGEETIVRIVRRINKVLQPQKEICLGG